MDSPDIGVIDFARFLAFAGSTENQRTMADSDDSNGEPQGPSEDQLKLLSDQKNYLEELNRHFEAKLKDSKGSGDESMVFIIMMNKALVLAIAFCTVYSLIFIIVPFDMKGQSNQ